MTSTARAIKQNYKAAAIIQPINQSQNYATSLGAYAHTYVHARMKVISRNQAHALFKKLVAVNLNGLFLYMYIAGCHMGCVRTPVLPHAIFHLAMDHIPYGLSVACYQDDILSSKN